MRLEALLGALGGSGRQEKREKEEDAGEGCFGPGCGCYYCSFHQFEEEVGTHMLAFSPTQLRPL